ncbi:MAG TPA: ABC transporter ATP-binding protein [Euzebya sp.]|nr:ABC transporter ATP-binding protein [Euzebya sp.]
MARRPLAPPTAAAPIVALTRASRFYPMPAGDLPGIAEVTLDVFPGEFVAVVGKSGSGKSTLLNLITGIDRPTSGDVQVAGRDLNPMSEDVLARWRGSQVGVIFQFQQLMPTLTVAENVMMPMDFLGDAPRAQRRARATALLALLDIAGQGDKMPGELSGGQQQRAAIARALANDPPLIAADEPTGNLDSTTADAVLARLRALADAGKAVVMVTHERDVARFTDRIVTVSDGHVIEDTGR